MEIKVNYLKKEVGYLHGALTNENNIFELIKKIHGVSELNLVIDKANVGNPFHQFITFDNFAGLLTYHDMVFQLNLFEFDSLDTVLDDYPKFIELDWSLEDRKKFTGFVHDSFNSKITHTLKQM